MIFNDTVRISFEFLIAFKDLEGADEVFIDVHESSVILELSAIIWGCEDGYQLSVPVELIPLLHYLMGSADKINVEVL